MMKILVFSFCDTGSIIFSTPLVRALKTQLDGVVIHYVIPEMQKFLVAENPYIDTVIAGTSDDVFYFLRRERYDLVINLENSVRVKIAALVNRVRSIRCKRPQYKHWLMVHLKINKLDGRHLVDDIFRSFQNLGLKQDDLGLDYFIPDKDHVPPEWLPQDFRREFVLFSIEAAYGTRKLPVTRIIELCDKVNKPVILVGSRDDAGIGEKVEQFFQRSDEATPWDEGLSELNKKTIVYNGCGKFNPNQVASLARRSLAVFTFDSAMVAIASAFRKKVYLVLGNTISLFGYYPYKTKFVILENNRLPCRPCSTTGFAACPLKHFNCMNKVVFDFYIP